MSAAPVTLLATVYSEPGWDAWFWTAALSRVRPASSVTPDTPGTARSASSRSPGTLALKPWNTENCWPTDPPNDSTARSGPFPAPGVSWTRTGTSAAADGGAAEAAVAIAGPATPAASRKAVATVATLRADRGSPPHVTPWEEGAWTPPLALLSITCTSLCCV